MASVSPLIQPASSEARKIAAGPMSMPTLIEAARARCSVGEIMNALADVFGRYDGAAKW